MRSRHIIRVILLTGQGSDNRPVAQSRLCEVDSQMSSSAFNASHREFYPFLHVMSIRELTQEAPTRCSLNVTLGSTYTSIYNRLCPFPMTGPIIAVIQYQATGINGAGEGTTHKVGTACTLRGQTRR